MDGLRWLLLLFGLLVVAGVYFFSRRERERAATDASADVRRAPSLGADSTATEAPENEPDDDDEDDVVEERPVEGGVSRQKIVTLRVVARNKGAFRGDELILSLRGIGMRSGKFEFTTAMTATTKAALFLARRAW